MLHATEREVNKSVIYFNWNHLNVFLYNGIKTIQEKDVINY